MALSPGAAMLRALSVRDVALIETLELEFGGGLTVLTGETGAGKSILLDALGLALGRRGRAEAVRAGAAQGSVTAVFEVGADHPSLTLLDAAGLSIDGDELTLRRVLTPDGRGRAFVNDQRAGAETLRALGETLVEVHGQHDDRGLLDAAGHRALLDAFAGCDNLRARVRSAWRAAAEADRAQAEAVAAADAARREEDWLRHAAAELDAFAPQPGEDDALDAARRRMQASARVGEEVARAAEEIGGQGAEGQAGQAIRRLERAARDLGALLDPAHAALSRALSDLAEAQDALGAALDALAFDPGALERTEERLFALRALARKHQVAPDALAELALDLRARLDALDAGEARIAALAAEAAAARRAYDAAAQALTAARIEAGGRLDAAMAAELAPLRMERARFRTEIAPEAPGPDGADRVVFAVATTPGAPFGPIARIASGGELSRFLLALKVCLSARGEGLTMIFDEIDRGVGGATADAVGRRLARLADGAQVLVVTHSPQVAARGAAHLRIAKELGEGVARTTVAPLSEAERTDEIARMLAGETVTDAARSAAEALLTG